MPNWKKVIVSGSDAALNSLNVTSSLTASGLIYPTQDGDNGDFLTTDGIGNLSFGRPNVYSNVKNVSGGELPKGTPVHATGTAGNTSEVIAASASVASTMPATFVLNETLANNAEGLALVTGYINGIDTSTFEEGDVVYVGVTGSYTNIKPQGSNNLIQNIGLVNKVNASNGSGYIYGSGRSNDVPNLPVGKIWVGSPTYSVTSSVVHLDESNGRVGINTDNPTYQLHVSSSTAALGVYERAGGAALYLEGQLTRGVMGTVGTHPLIFAYNSVETARFTGNSLLVTGSLDVSSGITGSALQLGNLGAENEILIVGANTQVTSSNLLAIDTVNQRVGIGTSTPQVKLDLVGESSGEAQVRVAQHDDTSDGPDIRFFKSHGTAAASSSVANNDYIGAVNAFAYDGSTYIQSGFFGFQADGTDGDSKFGLRTRVDGTLTDRITIDAAGDVGIEGSLDVQSGVTASSYTGSFIGDGSGLTGIISSSYAVTASHALNAGGSTALAFSYFNVSNSSLADNATYRLGQMTSLQTSVNAVAHIPLPSGTITEAYIGVYNASTFASGENITVNFLSDGGATSNTLSSTVTATSRHQEFIITGLSISINAGRTFVNIETPTFTTNPTAVQFRVGIKLEL